MTPVTIMNTIVFTIVTWAMWTRRHTWRNRWERGSTLGIALAGVGLFLCGPVGSDVENTLARWTGQYNVATFVGHVCLIAAVLAVLAGARSRLVNPARFVRWGNRPVGLFFVGMVTTFTAGGCAEAPLNELHTPGSLIYRAVVYATLTYLLVYLCAVLWALRGYCRHRVVAVFYLAASTVGLTAFGLRLIYVLLPADRTMLTQFLLSTLTAMWVGGIALAGVYGSNARDRVSAL